MQPVLELFAILFLSCLFVAVAICVGFWIGDIYQRGGYWCHKAYKKEQKLQAMQRIKNAEKEMQKIKDVRNELLIPQCQD